MIICSSLKPFSKQELVNYVEDPNIDTYFSKRYKPLLESAPKKRDYYFVSLRFKFFNTIEKFRKYFSQIAHIKGDYKQFNYNNLLIFEFFLPLNYESKLRLVLDDLFYKDTVKIMLARGDRDELNKAIPKKEIESDNEYYERLCDWISSKFCGYSIGTTSGRFKAYELKTFKESSDLMLKGRHYLIDETTAIVKFIFPIGNPIESETVYYNYNSVVFQEKITDLKNLYKEEIRKIKFFFKILFVKAILELVNGEDEIWMLESGLRKSKLYIWKSKN